VPRVARRTGTPFLARFAQINVHLTLSDRTINIVDKHIDLATKVGEIRRVVCGSPDYFAAYGVPKTPDDLANHMSVTFTALASGMTWIFNPRGKPTEGRAALLPAEGQHGRSSPRASNPD
jgi:hypothetical protein